MQPLPHDKVKVSYEQFLQQLDEDTLAEWVDGEVVFLSPAGLEHQQIADFLTAILNAFVQLRWLWERPTLQDALRWLGVV